MLKGYRRLSGIKLLSFAIEKNLDIDTFCDLIQWLLKSLRDKEGQIAHYSDNIQGCGESIMNQICNDFFNIIKMILVRIKTSQNKKDLIYLLSALYWNYQGNDLAKLSELDIIQVIRTGNGDPTHLIPLHWGK